MKDTMTAPLQVKKKSPITIMDSVIELLLDRYGITKEDLRGIRRKDEFVYVRQLFCYWVRWYYATEVSLNAIAFLINRTDHTTVIHAKDAFKSRIKTNSKLPKKIRHIAPGTKDDFLIVQKLIKIRCL